MAPDRLSTIQPRLGERFDDATPASARSRTCSRSIRNENDGHRCDAAPLRRSVFGRERSWQRTSDAPCRAPRHPETQVLRGARTASTTSASTGAAFSVQSAFHRQSLLAGRLSQAEFCGGAATSRSALPPMSWLPALFRSSDALARRG